LTIIYVPPSHNGSSLAVIKTCLSQLPDAKSIAFFDTAFHRSIPAHISSYAINPKIAKQRGLKKYGFHGLSCNYMLSYPAPRLTFHFRLFHPSFGLPLSAKGSTG
jgi:acetate kinase